MRYYIFIFLMAYAKCDISSYETKRAEIIALESYLSLGGNTTLNDKETLVNNCLMKYKFQEIDIGYENPEHYKFSRHFFKYKDDIKQSKVYKIIKSMPKGAVLHIHDTALMSPDYFVNITYMDYLYICLGRNKVFFQFSLKTPNVTCDVNWKLVKDARTAAHNVTKFDEDIRKHFTMVVDNPDVAYPTISESWTGLRQYFSSVYKLLTYRPVWEQYIYDSLKMFRNENLMYVELRTSLNTLYDLDGTPYDQVVTARSYRKIIKRFKKKYPDFVGAKIIYAPSRKTDTQTLITHINLARKIKKDFPDIFAGFDLVGQEDLGNPLIMFAPQLEAARDLNFFFHAGETDWYGTQSDMNLIDAVLLGAKRIGHAYALVKHPVVMSAVKDMNIALEVNVISNNVLSLVRDVRNHPLNVLLAHGITVVLSGDDPGAWEANVLSDDFYVAFVGVASRESDLRLLKTLALNSLKYSALDKPSKAKAIRNFNYRWDFFVNNFDCTLYE